MFSVRRFGKSDLLDNYKALVGKVDSLCREIMVAGGDSIVCRKGCDGCCRHISVFWVEAFNIAVAVADLDPERAEMVRDRARTMAEGDECPLLLEGSCLLYDQRPIICRSHGLPILIRSGETATIDFCPKNYRDADSLDGNHIIDLDRLNDTLAAVNTLFMKELFCDTPPSSERITISEAVLLRD